MVRNLAVDVGAGTQDVLLYDSRRTPENCFKLVLPSQTQVIGQRIREATDARRPIHLTGVVMGGGASTEAISSHLATGLSVTATPAAARTLHNDLERVRQQGVVIQDAAPPDAMVIELKDIDLLALARAVALFRVELPDVVAVAVQDHGFRPGAGNNAVRFEHLQHLLDGGGDFSQMVYRDPPADMLRMRAVAQTVPGVVLMDTGTAAVLGSLGDPQVVAAVSSSGAILVNVGNMHTFATLIKGRRLFGFFEHHTGGITPAIIGDLVGRLRAGSLDNETFMRDFDGHGAAVDPAYRDEGPFRFVAVTGPNRKIARPLGYHEAAPHGDMMLTGSFGLVEGTLLTMPPVGRSASVSLAAR
jgi:uncharacterized protein (DUF1786 family)